jgi:hypothetical protein
MFSLHKPFNMNPSLLKYIKDSTNNSMENIKQMHTIKKNNAVKMDNDIPNNLPFLFVFFGFISFLAGYHVKRITSK